MKILANNKDIIAYFFPKAQPVSEKKETEWSTLFREDLNFESKTEYKGFDLAIIEEFPDVSQFDTLALLPPVENLTIVTLSKNAKNLHGQLDRPWTCPVGGLLLTISVPMSLPVDRAHEIMVRSCVSMCKAARTCGVEKADISWPNDLYIGKKKAGGIIVHNQLDPKDSDTINRTTIGIGVNVETTPKIDTVAFAKPTCLAQEKAGLTLQTYLHEILLALGEDLFAPYETVRKEYDELMGSIGKEVVFYSQKARAKLPKLKIARGKIAEIDDELNCLLEGESTPYNCLRASYDNPGSEFL